MLDLFILFNHSYQTINMLMVYQLIDPPEVENYHDIVSTVVEHFQRYFQFLQNTSRCHLIRNTAQSLALFTREGHTRFRHRAVTTIDEYDKVDDGGSSRNKGHRYSLQAAFNIKGGENDYMDRF